VLAGFVALAGGQSPEFQLDADTGWTQTDAPPPGSDEAIISEARSLIARERFKEAERLMSRFIARAQREANPWLPDALLLRGDAELAQRNEYDALFDYERIIQQFPASDVFAEALERQFEIGSRYVDGLRRKFLGIRFQNARLLGEELLIRVQERLPSSTLAEEAAIKLADHYYERRDMELASEMYGIFLENFRESRHRMRAQVRQIFANIARFKGPEYDSGGLIDAGELIDRFQARQPAEAERVGITAGLEARLDESAALKKLEIARWYFRRNDEPAARFMLQRLIREHPRSNAAQTALRTLEERGWIRGRSGDTPAPDGAAREVSAEPSP